MAMGKIRTSKRSSGTSYTSTVTTVVFVSLCVLGVWMLTSNNVVPPQTTTAISTDADADSGLTTTNADYSNKDSNQAGDGGSEKAHPVFEDNPGLLPEDAIRNDDQSHPKETGGGEGSKEEQERVAEENLKKAVHLASSEERTKEAESNNIKDDQPESGKQQPEQENNAQSLLKKAESVFEDQIPQPGLQVKDQVELEQAKPETTTTSQLENSESINADQSSKQEEAQNAEGDHSSMKEQQESILMQDQQQQKEEEKPKPEDEKPDQQQTTVQQENNIHEGTSQDQVEHDEALPAEPNASSSNADQQMPQETATTTQSQPDQKTVTEGETQPKKRRHKHGGKNKEDIKQTKEKVASSSSSDDSSALLGGENSGIPKESKESKKSWATQADQSENEKERRKSGPESGDGRIYGYTWKLCNVTAGPDYIPCLDNEKAVRQLHSTRHFEHRERHCPDPPPTCLVPLPQGYKKPVEWPRSREQIWYHNVPHTKLAEVKGHQNWVKVTGEFLTFPGGGTQFIHGALHYIDFIQESVPEIAWGKHTRVILDVGCGVASFGGYLFEKDVLAMSFAPKDEHEAQVQFALERGIPAISAVMGSQRLPFPSRVFDLLHCARCRVPWHAEGGSLLLELNRVLRPGGYFVWSATPVYQTLEEDVEIWKEMSALTKSMCWELVTIKKDKLNSVGAAIYHKPVSNECYEQRKQNQPPMCKNEDDPNAAWYVPLQSCMHRVPEGEAERGSQWPEEWPLRLQTPPYWLNKSQMGIYGKPAPEDFTADCEHWKKVVSKTYLNGLGISWGNVRNVMDMRAVYGGFATAMREAINKVWVLNVVNVDSPDTLPIIYERGLFGIYHDWCESFSTYPRSYDLLHADHLFSRLKKRCKIPPVMAEIDRIVRPGGKLIVRDESAAIGEVENLLKSLRWEVHLTFSKNQEGILSAQKSDWRPDEYAAAPS
ncbi:probable methyltransferase PMT27 [Diospyros lotus]|uniref:probable methyltransferase PMT27 n=1 Tax=Diospyros lotus TaxID=55363 RepID=UPI002252242E|nr:probable methyltransferase PMT27 [Diospyros lotus]